MPLSIKNDETERLARLVARETGETITDAIQNALRERLQRVQRQRKKRVIAESLQEILRRVDSLPTLDQRSPEEILGYDANGLPG